MHIPAPFKIDNDYCLPNPKRLQLKKKLLQPSSVYFLSETEETLKQSQNN